MKVYKAQRVYFSFFNNTWQTVSDVFYDDDMEIKVIWRLNFYSLKLYKFYYLKLGR